MKLTQTIILALCATLSTSIWAGKSVYINPALILKQAPQAIAASKAMEKEFKGRELKLRALLEEIKSKEEKYNKDSAIMSESQKKKTEEDILAKKREFRFNQQSLKEDLQRSRTEAVKALQSTISGVIQAYGKKNGYDFIFTEGVAYADDSLNITDEILEELKK